MSGLTALFILFGAIGLLFGAVAFSKSESNEESPWDRKRFDLFG